MKEEVKRFHHWRSIPINLVAADSSGNIGYSLLVNAPIRKNGYPYLGCKVLDGTTSKHDWEGFLENS